MKKIAKTINLKVRVTPRQHEQLKAVADAHSLTLAAYTRQLIERETKIFNNINQIK